MRKIFSILSITLLCVFIIGCSNNNLNTNKNEETINLSNIQNKIEELDIECTKSDAFYQMVGAIDGFKLHSGEYRIEIYKFDTTSESYKIAEKNQELTIEGLSTFKATVKNGYAYTIESGFPKYDDVISILNKLK